MTTLQGILLGLTVANWVLLIGLYRLMGKLQGQFKAILEILTQEAIWTESKLGKIFGRERSLPKRSKGRGSKRMNNLYKQYTD